MIGWIRLIVEDLPSGRKELLRAAHPQYSDSVLSKKADRAIMEVQGDLDIPRRRTYRPLAKKLRRLLN